MVIFLLKQIPKLIVGDGSNGVSEIINFDGDKITIEATNIAQFPAPYDSKTKYGYLGGTIANNAEVDVLVCGGATHEAMVKGLYNLIK